MPRRRLRTQLTLLYAVPFLLSGAALLSIPILQTSQSEPVMPGLNPGAGVPPHAQLDRILAASAAGLAVMVGVAIVLGWLIAGRFLRPLRTITATARDISASNLHRRLGRTGRRDEFTELAGTLDELFERLEAAFEAQRHFVANASHELRTPLTAERTLLQVALADPDATPETLRAACRDVLALGAAQERLIDALLTLASGEQVITEHESVDLAELARRVLATRGESDIKIDAALAAAPTTGDPRLLESLVANLVDNALRHNAPGGRVEIATSADLGRARLTVRNTGPVIPPDEVERLFQPFQRLGGPRVRHDGGHGLGLAIVRAIAGAHGATLAARPRAGGGLEIEVHMP
jgi:signal transduction histidine kinase